MTQIGLAPLFHSDLTISQRLDAKSSLAIKETQASWSKDICLFTMPEHLRKKWWDLCAPAILNDSGEGKEFAQFVKEFRAFADYKLMPLAPQSKFSMLIRASGQENSEPSKACQAIVNVGDEDTHINVGGETILLRSGDGCWSPQLDLFAGEVSGEADLDVLFRIQAGSVVATHNT